MHRRALYVSGAVLLAIAGWSIGLAVAQDQGNSDAAMMKKMMTNRPEALKKADAEVQAAKQAAVKAGHYTCCLKHSCDFCALKMGACPCGANAANDKPVCNECKGGWYAGDGALAGKTANDIKTFPRGMEMTGGGAAGATAIVDVWHCPILGTKITDGHGVGTPVVVGNYRVHFCCAGCPAQFAAMSDKQQLAAAEAAAKKDGSD